MPFLSGSSSNQPASSSSTIAQTTLEDFKSPTANRKKECNKDTTNISKCTAQKEKEKNIVNNDNYITIIHFNDCYNIEPSAQSSGAAGFLTAINQHRHLNPLILFSGDIMSPSFISTFTKGEQMIPVLNDIGVHCAVFGNHEFDFGVDNLIQFAKKTTFPWLLSNVVDKETSNQLGDGQVFHIIERGGIKFGIIGLIEEEWLSTLATLDPCDVIYEDFVTKGQELAKMLKSEPHNVDYVIALTHFRKPNDIRLADSVPEIDLILGGHDHDYDIIKRPNCYIIKSGTDFREFSKITLKFDPNYIHFKDQEVSSQKLIDNVMMMKKDKVQKLNIIIERIECFNYPPDENLKMKLDKFQSTIDEKMSHVLGQFSCDLDGRFSSIRNYETNLGNFVTDIMLASTHADLAILNSGTLRSDRIHPKGDFTMRDLYNILGYIDPIAVLSATGKQIWIALENGVSQWPKLEGRFPQVSGCSFTFDPSKPPMQRIDPKFIFIGDEMLQLDKHYRLTTKDYLASGKDGYDILKDCLVILPGDESPDLTTSILNHFEAINIVKSRRRTHHRQSIICLSRNSLKKIIDHSSSITSTNSSIGSRDQIESEIRLQNKSEISSLSEADGNNNEEQDQESAHQIGRYNEELKTSSCELNLTMKSSSCLLNPIQSNIRKPSISGENYEKKKVITSSVSLSPSICPPLKTKRMMSLDEMEHEQCKLNPQVEGRIRIVGHPNSA